MELDLLPGANAKIGVDVTLHRFPRFLTAKSDRWIAARLINGNGPGCYASPVTSQLVPRVHRYTYRDYLEHESSSNVKHEFVDGEIYAMAGGTVEHAVITMNVGVSLATQLRSRPCVVASPDLKVRALATGFTGYPDVTVICGAIERDPASHEVVLNPTVVVEVLSDSTEAWDRGEKLDHYKRIPSLHECLLVSHHSRRLEVFRRAPDGSWTTETAGPGETLSLSSIGCLLATDDVYRNVVVA